MIDEVIMAKLDEAATIRNQAKSAAKALKDLLAEKTLPAALRKQIESVHQALGKTWADLETDATTDPEAAPAMEALREAATLGAQLEGQALTMLVDLIADAYEDGSLTQVEYNAMLQAAIQASAAITAAAPDTYTRNPMECPPEESEGGATPEGGMMAEESGELAGDFIALTEKSVKTDGTFPVKIIQPGWGSSGYYPAAVLERDGPNVFKKGLHMYFDHPTLTEERDRPERSLRDLAAELTTPARYEANNPAGPGLYAEAKAIGAYRDAINELAPHIGVSIRALGRAKAGTADGKSGPIIEAITAAKSVDFVTSPGAGGQVLQLFEAQRTARTRLPEEVKRMEDSQKLEEVNAQLTAELTETRQNLARLQELHVLREASDFVAGELAAVKDLPEITKHRLQRDLSAKPVVKDGKLDESAYRAAIVEAVKAEAEYIAGLTGAGKVRGMGGASGAPTPDYQKSLTESFKLLGLGDTTAAIAAKGR